MHAKRCRMGTAKSNKTSTNVLDLLTAQHSEVDALFAKLEKGTANKDAVFQELADKVAAHATAEEKVFYPQVMSKQTNDMLHESVEEHLQVKRTLADMLSLATDSREFAAKLKVLKEDLSHHAHEEEEDKLFPMLRKSMSEDELAAIGNQVLELFENLLPQHPAKNVRNETAKAAPLPSA
jgi:hemerythrin superfamily protein